jgi:4-alpha-glucanotransferase
MRFPRSSGILLHPTSLPGRFGIGDLGSEAYHWVNFLERSGQSLWQVLPLGPTGYGDSPYQCFSAFAGNPLLISPEKLVEEDFLSEADLEDTPPFPVHKVDYGWVITFKMSLLRRAFANFQAHASLDQRTRFVEFCETNRAWLDDYGLFMALKDAHGGVNWGNWERDVRMRQPEALAHWSHVLADEVRFHQFIQHLFFQQWLALKEYANARRIQIIGDIPIFVAYDSADVWANPQLFYLDETGQPTVVAGVPPDYFSPTGQLWGNPLYRWDVMAGNGYVWWIERFRATLTVVDIVRLDHFRGFEAYWEVPASEDTAINGQWVKAPGAELFAAVEQALGKLPIIAEDLGVITSEVVAMRERFEFPGMKILQFAFTSDPKAMVPGFLPHNFERNYVVYTGTHDNDTTLGWFNAATPGEREAAQKYIGVYGLNIPWAFIRLGFASVADMAVVPLQDVLSLGSEARMNHPSKVGGWWSWRVPPGMLTDAIADRLRELAAIYGRLPQEPEPTHKELPDGAS